MKLIVKFNLVFVGVFLLGMLVAGGVSYRLLQQNAREEILQNARIMMEDALAQRQYTVQQIKPLLETQLRYKFLPQSVPAYSATEAFDIVHKKYPDFSYKEAALNPTNPRNRAVEWEEDILRQFRDGRAEGEIIGERETPTGYSLFLARPIQIKDQACLVCHNVPIEAPGTMIERYGPANGFGWKKDEIVATQIVSVPTMVARERAMHTFQFFMLSLTGVFLFIFVALNLMLRFIVIRPVTRLAALADQVSLGELNLPEFKATSQDEIGGLAASFGRMRKSLEKAMKMLEE
jgi:HAMP domain-containing protein